MIPSSALPRTVTVRAPAKVNCELRVGGLRRDGYHELSTVFMAVGLYDEVTVTRSPSWEVTTTGRYAALVPDGADNLALRAARVLASTMKAEPIPVSIRIDKEIPVAGGMAGGSADAAAALLACDALWGLRCDREQLLELAADVGSDVPFSLAGGIAVGSGRGERLAPVLAKGTFHWVFVVSSEGLSTPSVFAECDRLRADADADADADRPAPGPSSAVMTALRSGDPEALGKALANDLQTAALSLRPALRTVLDAGVEFGALGAIVSGSGPTIAFLTGSPEHALDLCVSLAASGVADEVTRAKGPVHGAHFIAVPSRV